MPKVLEWINWYHELEKYYEEHGNVNVSQKYETKDGLKLGKWLNNQRLAYIGKGSCKITKNQIQLLDDLGMIWNCHVEKWDKNYYALEEYYKKYGNIDVSQKYETEDGINLGSWLHAQRQAYKGKGNCKITHDQIQLLNDLNIEWNPRDTRLLNMKIKKDDCDKYYEVLENRLNHVLTDISYEVSNEITEENQKELCKQIIKRVWR